MQNSSNNNNGDLATVYASTQANMEETTQAQYITFPETVTLPSAVTDYVEVQFKAVDESIMLDCWGELSSTRFSMDLYIDGDGDWINYRIQYESSDGINYTRTRFEDQNQNQLENPVDMTTPIVFGSRWGTPTWNDLIGYFMIVGSTLYTGLWEYISTNNQFEHVPTQINVTVENIYGNKKAFDGSNTITGTLHQTNNLSIDQIKTRVNLYQNLSYLELNEDVTNMSNMFAHISNLIAMPNINTTLVTDMSEMFTEMATVGVTMAVIVTAVWALMLAVVGHILRRSAHTEAQ